MAEVASPRGLKATPAATATPSNPPPPVLWERLVPGLVVGDEDAPVAVGVVVGGADPHGSPIGSQNTHPFRDIFERAVSPIAIQNVRLAGISERAREAVGGEVQAVLGIELDVVADVQVEQPVVVVVEPNGPDADTGVPHRGPPREVGERTVAVVVEVGREHVWTPVTRTSRLP